MAKVRVVLDSLMDAGYSDLFVIESALDEINIEGVKVWLGGVVCPPLTKVRVAVRPPLSPPW